jgi:hypothetical protein
MATAHRFNLKKNLNIEYYEQQESLETIKLLHERLALNSQNSSKPPSTDGYAKPKPKSLRCSSGKKTGGQPGHPGTTLKPVEVPDIHKTHPLSICPCGCGSDLSKLPVIKLSAPRQVFDLPPQRLICTEVSVNPSPSMQVLHGLVVWCHSGGQWVA